MSKDNKVVVNAGFPVLGILGSTLIVLKLLGKITIPWVWVLAPFWIPAAIIIVLLIVALTAYLKWGD